MFSRRQFCESIRARLICASGGGGGCAAARPAHAVNTTHNKAIAQSRRFMSVFLVCLLESSTERSWPHYNAPGAPARKPDWSRQAAAFAPSFSNKTLYNGAAEGRPLAPSSSRFLKNGSIQPPRPRRRGTNMKTRALRSQTKRRLFVAAWLWLLLMGVALAPGSLLAAAVQDGFYTATQAQRGQALYDKKCASCHGLQLEGAAAAALAGSRFMTKWGQSNHTADELYFITRTQMPYGAGNTLSAQQYIDIIAYVLKANGYPAGSNDLPASSETLKRITIASRGLSKEQMRMLAPPTESKPQATDATANAAPSTAAPTQQELN